MKDFFKIVFDMMISKPNFIIDSRSRMEEAVRKFGILPFFPNNVRGLSIEEMCAPGLLFGGNFEEGCWEWKGPVIRERNSVYGKFFRKKAGFVSLEILPDFLNFRRSFYPVIKGSMDEMLLEIIKENDSLSSTELKHLIFGKKQRTEYDELPIINEYSELKPKSKSLESPLQRLQMGGWIIISDFEYKKTKWGERYGWGVARYSTPEIEFGDLLINSNGHTPKKSLEYLIKYVKERWTSASENSLEFLLK